jgi:hypothetical protein
MYCTHALLKVARPNGRASNFGKKLMFLGTYSKTLTSLGNKVHVVSCIKLLLLVDVLYSFHSYHTVRSTIQACKLPPFQYDLNYHACNSYCDMRQSCHFDHINRGFFVYGEVE